jgi:ABC-type dipeptide/oligopeptide/nickel transport system permease component
LKQYSKSRAELRLVAGFALLPPTAALLIFLISLVSWKMGIGIFSGGKPTDPLQAAISLALAIAIIAILVTVFAGVPTVMLLARRRPVTLRSLLLAGAALGNLPFALIVSAIAVQRSLSGTIEPDISALWFGVPGAARSIGLGLVCGTTCATVFWVIAIRGIEVQRLSDNSPEIDRSERQ